MFSSILAALLIALPLSHANSETSPVPQDTTIVWWSGGRDVPVRLQLYESGDTARPLTVIVYDDAEIGGRVLAEDARLFAETAGRMLNFDPAEAFFVFRYDAVSFVPEAQGRRVLLLRATFRPVRSGGVGNPSWRLITHAELALITDRAAR